MVRRHTRRVSRTSVGRTDRCRAGRRRTGHRHSMMHMRRSLLLLATITAPVAAQQSSTTFHQLGHAILRELIETNTTGSSGNTTVAAQQLQTRFELAGFPAADMQIVGPTPKNRNLVVRYRASGAHKPILLLRHLDVVE